MRIAKFRMIRSAGHVTRMGGRQGVHTEFWYEILLENDRRRDQEEYRRLARWILRRWAATDGHKSSVKRAKLSKEINK